MPVTFTFEDMLRPDADTVIASLRREGIKVEMLSGDRPAAVARAAKALGLEASLSRMSPQAKLAHVEELASLGRKVLVVGDGINDAPALAAGFVSMAPATASDIGRTAADVVFMGRSLEPVTLVRSVAIAAQSIARQNVAARSRLQYPCRTNRDAWAGYAIDRSPCHVVIEHHSHRQRLAPWLASSRLANRGAKVRRRRICRLTSLVKYGARHEYALVSHPNRPDARLHLARGLPLVAQIKTV